MVNYILYVKYFAKTNKRWLSYPSHGRCAPRTYWKNRWSRVDDPSQIRVFLSDPEIFQYFKLRLTERSVVTSSKDTNVTPNNVKDIRVKILGE